MEEKLISEIVYKLWDDISDSVGEAHKIPGIDYILSIDRNVSSIRNCIR